METEQSRCIDACHRRAKLYGFFLGVAHKEVTRIVHQELPRDGEFMYRYLEKRILDCKKSNNRESKIVISFYSN